MLAAGIYTLVRQLRNKVFPHPHYGAINMETIIRYLKQPSTWQGLIAIVTSFGIALHPDQVAAIVAAGVGVVGLIDVFWDTDA